MSDGSSRLSLVDGQQLFHFMGCSTFSEYTVIHEISAAIVPSSRVDLDQICMLGCGVSTGWGAVANTCAVHKGSSVVVFGLGAVGLSVIQMAKFRGAKVIVGVDLNTDKFKVATELGMTVGMDGGQKDIQ